MSFVVSGNEQAVSCHEIIMVFGHFIKTAERGIDTEPTCFDKF